MAIEVPGHPSLRAKFKHERPLRFRTVSGRAVIEVSATGGATVCEIYDGETLVSRGVSRCHPNDNYDKKLGRTVSMGRAIKALG